MKVVKLEMTEVDVVRFVLQTRRIRSVRTLIDVGPLGCLQHTNWHGVPVGVLAKLSEVTAVLGTLER
jgi:hypothetical protein